VRLDFSAAVSQDGTLRPDDMAGWRVGVARFRGQRLTVSLESVRLTRSGQQNRRYWGVILVLVAEVLSIGRELPISRDQAHFVCKLAFLGQEDTALGPVPKSTRTLSTKDFSDYCDRICSWLYQEHGVVVPGLGETQEIAL
jgi:hypothetical protein